MTKYYRGFESDQDYNQAVFEAMAKCKPCPFCGSLKLKFDYTTSYGHGDSGFSNACIRCECSASKGEISGYGTPRYEEMEEAVKEWNERF